MILEFCQRFDGLQVNLPLRLPMRSCNFMVCGYFQRIRPSPCPLFNPLRPRNWLPPPNSNYLVSKQTFYSRFESHYSDVNWLCYSFFVLFFFDNLCYTSLTNISEKYFVILCLIFANLCQLKMQFLLQRILFAGIISKHWKSGIKLVLLSSSWPNYSTVVLIKVTKWTHSCKLVKAHAIKI